jgi:outer membrane receptor for ferrienterochelin and colicin
MRTFLLSLLILFASLIHAQVDLQVLVLDEAAEPQENVRVRLESEQLSVQLEQTTNRDGITLFKGLQPGGPYYVFQVQTKRKVSVFLTSNKDQVVTLVDYKETEVEEVVISGRGLATINPVNAEVSAALPRKTLTSIPVEGRDITRSLYRLPNVSQATGFYPEAPNVAINGANSLFTSYLIDGMDNNERFLGGMKFNIPVGMVENISVLTNNFSTEFGNTANGVVNITTRTGSNELHGEVFYLTRPGPGFIDAASPYNQRDLSGNFVKDGFMRQQAGFAVGGALKKDKTFFFLNAEQTFDFKDNLLNAPQIGLNATVPGNNSFTYLSGKLTQLWSDKLRSNVRVHLGQVYIDRQGGGLEGGVNFPSAGNRQDRNSLLIASQNTWVSSTFKAEANLQYSRFRWNYGAANNPGSPQVTVFDPAGVTMAVLGHPGFIFDQTENTLQFQQKFNWYLGKHTVKAGLELISGNHLLFGGGNVNGNYLVQLSEGQLNSLQGFGVDLGVEDIPADVSVLGYNVELRQAQFGKRQNILSAYLEDRFRASEKLSITLGLRYDYDNLTKGGSSSGDLNNIAPRISANYRLGKLSSLRAGAGLFYEKIAYAIYSDALQQNTTGANYRRQVQALVDQGILPADTDVEAVTFDGNLTASADNVSYLQGPSPAALQENRNNIFSNERRILNPNGYQSPQSLQFMVGYQQQVNDNTLFYVDVMHNRSTNLFRLRDLNAPAPYAVDPDNPAVRSQVEADLSRPVPILSDGSGIIGNDTLRGLARRVTVTETAGASRFWAVNMNLVKERGEDDFAWRLHYTLSSLRNNTEDINFTAMDANDFEAESGPSINDRRHMINAMYFWYPLKGLSINLAALLQSGQPINRIPDASLFGGTTDLNGDGRSFGSAYVGNSDRQPGESRNSDRLPWSNTFDLGLQYDLPLDESRLHMRVDIFNAVNLSGYSNNATQSNQIQVGPADSGLLVRRNAAPPRQFQFGLGYHF